MDELISPSDLALYSKLLGDECLIHVDTEGTVKKAKELVAEADRLHKAGSHSESVAKAQEALAGLK